MSNPICLRCGCCTMYWEECWNCDEGYSSHDCGEDCCCCDDPEPNVTCDICGGKGGYYVCDCDEKGRHALRTVEQGAAQ